MALEYLTLQDVLWINLQVTGTPQTFRYEDLEEATFYQYSYGESKSLIPQASRFLTGFLKKKPFTAGNEATAFVACLAFLKVNGVDLKLDDAHTWFTAIHNGTHEAQDAIEKHHFHAPREHHVDIREAISEVLTHESATIEKLGEVLA